MKKLILTFSLLTNIVSFPTYADGIKFYYKPSADPPDPYVKGHLLNLNTEDDSKLAKFKYKQFNEEKKIYEEKIINIHISRILSIDFNKHDNNPEILQIKQPEILIEERPGAFIPLTNPHYGRIKFDPNVNIKDYDGESSSSFIEIVGTLLYYNRRNRKIIVSYLTSVRKWNRRETVNIRHIDRWQRENEPQ